jgi:amino acid transporter
VAQATSTALVRGIRRWDLVAFGINFVVGAGIFGLPSKVFALAGSLSLVAYVLCAAAVFLIVLCFAEVGSRFTETGGPYLFAREALGDVVGFEVGWLRSVAGVTSFAANSNLLVDYLSFGWTAANNHRAIIITVIVLLLTTINVIGVRDAARASNIFAIGKLLPMFLFVIVGLFFIHPQNFLISTTSTFGNVSTSALLLMQAFAGFESMTIAAGEVHDPQRTVPFALFTTIVVVMLLYALIQVVCIGTLPELASSTRPLADAANRFLGPVGGYVITAGAVASITGNLNAQLFVTPRTIFAMAEQEQLPQVFAAVHNRFHTPYFSICFSAVVILAFALSGTFIQLLTIAVLARLLVYLSTCIALPVLRRRDNIRPPAFKAPAGVVVATASVALCLWLLSSSTKREALTTAVAAGIGLVCCALYRLTKPRLR